MYRVLALISMTVVLLTAGVQAQAPASATAQVDEAPPLLAVPAGYKYDSRGRRDPFVNPIPKPTKPEADIPVIRPPGLKGVLVSEAKLMGVVTSKEPGMNKVVIQAPGNKTYFAARGDALFDAVVKEIRPDAVVFLLAPPKGQPQLNNREVVRKVNPAPGENR